MSSQADGLTTADFVTTSHRISGQVQTGVKPLSDFLNDHSQSYLMAYNVYVSRLDRAGEVGTHAPMAYLSKDNLSFVVVPAREARAPDRNRYAAVEYEVLVTMAGFEVRGKFVGPHRIDLRTFSPATLESFLLLSEATADVMSVADLSFQGDAILVNRSRLQSLCLIE
ncbi:MAG: hypothetical protein P8129_17270 [Anaerolineae bacterium]|jgi:hypothetical protein